MQSVPGPTPRGGDVVKRHGLMTRLWHWLNAIAVTVMLMSGLMIFNAHPRLYWGHYGANPDPAWLDLSQVNGGIPFPGAVTIPTDYSLADARLWHLAFAWPLAAALCGYLVWALLSGRLRREIVPTPRDLAPRNLRDDIAEHARLRFPTGAAALRYGVLQRLAYSAVLLILLPGMVLTGLAMSPAMDAGWPWLVDLLGGRQSARSVHFLCAAALVGFVAVHLAMVALSGPINGMRAMLSGRYRLPLEAEQAE
ncbi:MAG: cytochrome b/b6 domain-containing protein [Sphingomonadales bacterium]|nr:cytochrome b/b6 domain-containing protein [Sphingomonadales bacterium]